MREARRGSPQDTGATMTEPLLNPYDCENVAFVDAQTYSVEVRVSDFMLDRLIDEWSEPLQIRLQRIGDELVPVFRVLPR